MSDNKINIESIIETVEKTFNLNKNKMTFEGLAESLGQKLGDNNDNVLHVNVDENEGSLKFSVLNINPTPENLELSPNSFWLLVTIDDTPKSTIVA